MDSISVEKESSWEDVDEDDDDEDDDEEGGLDPPLTTPGFFPPNWFSVSLAKFPTEDSLSPSEGGRRKTPLEPVKKREIRFANFLITSPFKYNDVNATF